MQIHISESSSPELLIVCILLHFTIVKIILLNLLQQDQNLVSAVSPKIVN